MVLRGFLEEAIAEDATVNQPTRPVGRRCHNGHCRLLIAAISSAWVSVRFCKSWLTAPSPNPPLMNERADTRRVSWMPYAAYGRNPDDGVRALDCLGIANNNCYNR